MPFFLIMIEWERKNETMSGMSEWDSIKHCQGHCSLTTTKKNIFILMILEIIFHCRIDRKRIFFVFLVSHIQREWFYNSTIKCQIRYSSVIYFATNETRLITFTTSKSKFQISHVRSSLPCLWKIFDHFFYLKKKMRNHI